MVAVAGHGLAVTPVWFIEQTGLPSATKPGFRYGFFSVGGANRQSLQFCIGTRRFLAK